MDEWKILKETHVIIRNIPMVPWPLEPEGRKQAKTPTNRLNNYKYTQKESTGILTGFYTNTLKMKSTGT